MNAVPIKPLLALLAGLLLATACALGGRGDPVSIMSPDIPLAENDAWPQVDWTLQVRRPAADQTRDSPRILVRVPPSRLQPWPAAAWLDTAPEMLQSIMIQALEDSGRINGISRPGTARARYSLTSELRRFEAVDSGDGDLQIELVVNVNLIHQRSSRTLAGQRFEHRARAEGSDLEAVMRAFESALAEFTPALVTWTLEEGEKAEARREEFLELRGDGGWLRRRDDS